MERSKAANLVREELNKYGLTDWKVKISTDPKQSWLGICIYKDKTIIINSHHCDIHPDSEVIDTIKHEVAHALTPGHNHDDVWRAKAKEIGCINTLPCSHLSFPPAVIDAIRSGKLVELEIEEETVVIRHPKYKITQLKELCPFCGKTAVERFRKEYIDKKTGDTIQLNTLECFHVVKKVIPRGTAFDELVTNWWRPHVAACKHEWTKTKCNNCGEFKLMQFQVNSALFVEKALALQKGAGVFHEMGLGKTMIVLAYLRFHKKRTLFVVKSATSFQWFKEIVRVLGPEALPQIIRSSKDFIFPGLRSYVISYDLLRRMDQETMASLGIEVVVLDECQQIKNPDSTRTKEVRKLVGGDVKVVALSGTPWKNRGSEFFAVLNMMDPIKFHSYQHFLDTWVSYYWHGEKRKEGGIKNPERFKAYIETLAIRYEYNEVMDEFPDVNRMKLNMQMDEMDQSTYDDVTSDFVKWYNQFVIDGTEDSIDGMEILAKLTRMRHITGLAKIPATIGFMEEFYESTDRNMVIFVHHIDVGQVLMAELKKKFPDVCVAALSANMTPEEKNDVIFNKYQKMRTFIVASTKASGEGVDGLQTGYDAILHERQWNPPDEDQAAPGRFKRIGQKSPIINVTCVQAEGTVDEHLDAIVEPKRNEFHKAMNKGEVVQWVENDIVRDLAKSIVAKHKEKNKGKNTDKPKVKLSEIASL